MEILDSDIQLIKEAIKTVNWEIRHLYGAELNEVRSKYSDSQPNYDREHLVGLIRQKARESICTEDGQPARAFFYKISRHFQYRIILENTKDELFCNVAEKLFHFFETTVRLAPLTSENLNFTLLCLKDYLRLYNSTISNDKIEYVDCRIRSICKSILVLKREASVNYLIKNGNVWVDSQEFDRVGKLIKDKMRSLGGLNFLKTMSSFLIKTEKYDANFKRYHFPISTSQVNDKNKASPPWGYLFNLAIQFPNVGDQKVESKPELWNQIIEVSTALVSALDVEPYSTWDTEFKTGTDAVKMMSDISLLESNFKLPQIRSSDLLLILKGCLSWVQTEENPSFEVTYSDLNYFLNRLLKFLAQPDPVVIKIKELRKNMKRLSDDKFKFALDIFTHSLPPNQQFVSPSDHVNVDGFFKPLITVDSESVLIPCPPYSSYAAIESICTYFRRKIKSFDDKAGEHLEDFIRQRLSKFNVTIKHGDYTNSDGEDGEIDAAIEFDDLIVLIELKKKSFTRKARSGLWDSVLIDIHKSLLDSQHQALGHEYSLEKDRQIKFRDGTILQLNDRAIEKVTLVLFDYGAIQDRTIIKQLLLMYLQCRFSSKDDGLNKQFAALNEKCESFNKRYSKYSALLSEPPNIPFFGSWFFSIPQFLALLDNVSNSKDLKSALWHTKFVTLKALDWYYEHSYMRNLKGTKA